MIGLCGVVATLVNFQNKTFSRKSSSPEQTCGNSQCQETTTAKCDRLLNQFGFIQTKEKYIFTYKDENDIVFLVNSGKLFILYDKRINLFMPIELFRLYMMRIIINLVLNTWWYFKIRLLFFIEQSSGKGPTDDKLKNYFMKMIDEIFVGENLERCTDNTDFSSKLKDYIENNPIWNKISNYWAVYIKIKTRYVKYNKLIKDFLRQQEKGCGALHLLTLNT